MTFQEYRYQRPDFALLTQKFEQLLQSFATATDFDTQNIAFAQINQLRNDFATMYDLTYIRHTLDTRDQFYEGENNFFDEHSPAFTALVNQFYQKLVTSQFRAELEARWGKQLFTLADLSLRTFDPSIMELLQAENKLTSEYVKIKGDASIAFEGKNYNLTSIHVPEIDPDRHTRKAASEAKWVFYATQQAELDRIFDELVQVRHKMAQALGYENFIELGYARMARSDYNATMLARFREQVQEHIVPIASRLYERQRQRLGIETLQYYDEDFGFPSGNAAPKGSPEFIVKAAQQMYAELSPDTKTFFEFMQQRNLMDLTNRDGKYPSGYCTYIPKYQSPYIFSNFNGTSGDIDVLTHEVGHAFQVFMSRDLGISEYNWPTTEACEIHSMSMEFFTWRWMELFFDTDAEKYRFKHLAGALQFLPYGVAVDEFQHFVYQNPHISPAERHAAWKNIEQKYLPHRDYDGNSYLEQGAFWQKQNHIFQHPFYYIDYALAQICAFQFWKKDRENHQTAWADYVRLCKAGGSQSFLSLVELAGLRSPFESDCVASVVGEISAWLDSVDDSRF
jgi:M3 family oligoendopeptidase